jgi:hypothetical protein
MKSLSSSDQDGKSPLAFLHHAVKYFVAEPAVDKDFNAAGIVRSIYAIFLLTPDSRLNRITA